MSLANTAAGRQENSRRSNFKSLGCGQQSQSSKKRHYFSVKLLVLHKLPKLLESDFICWPAGRLRGAGQGCHTSHPGIPLVLDASNALARRVWWLASCEADEPPLTLPNNVHLLVQTGLRLNFAGIASRRRSFMPWQMIESESKRKCATRDEEAKWLGQNQRLWSHDDWKALHGRDAMSRRSTEANACAAVKVDHLGTKKPFRFSFGWCGKEGDEPMSMIHRIRC